MSEERPMVTGLQVEWSRLQVRLAAVEEYQAALKAWLAARELSTRHRFDDSDRLGHRLGHLGRYLPSEGLAPEVAAQLVEHILPLAMALAALMRV